MKNELSKILTRDADAIASGLGAELAPYADERLRPRIHAAARAFIEHIAAAAAGSAAHDPATLRALARLADTTSSHTAAHTAHFLTAQLQNTPAADQLRDTIGRILILAIESMLPDPAHFFDTLARDSDDVYGNFTDIVYLVDIDGIVRYVNPAVKTVLGYEPEEIIGKHSTEFIQPNMVNKVNEQLDKYRQGEVLRAQNEYEVPHRDGSLRVIEVNGTILRDGGRPVGFQGIARDVTYRHELENRLRQERDKLDAAISGIGAGLVVLDPDFNVVWINDRAREWLPHGFDVIGKRCHEVFHNRDCPCELCVVRESLRTGKPEQIEKPLIPISNAAGDTFLFTAAPVRNAHGDIVQMIEMIQDVTTTRINAEKTRFWQEFYLKVVQNAPVGIVTLEPTGEVLTWNRYMENTYSISAADVVGKNILDEFPTLAREDFDSWLKRVEETRQPLVIFDWKHSTRHKGERIIDLMFYPLLDSNGDLLGLAYINSDVTERRRIQWELEQTRDFLARLFHSVTDYVFLIRPDGAISDANRAAGEIFRFNPEEIKNASWSDFFKSTAEFEEFMSEVLTKKRIDYMEIELRDRVGAPRHVLQSATVLQSVGGEPEAIAVVGKDVTDLRLMQERMLRIQRLNALGELASGVAHDFNNLLAVILGRSQLLLKRTTDENQRKGLEVIERAARHGSETIKRIQSFARKPSDSECLDDVDINEIMSEAIEFTRTRWKNDAQARGVAINMDFRPGLDCLARGTSHELIEVFTNLILNAVDAMPHGGDLSIVTERRDDFVLVSVTDSGVGMPLDVKRRIFDPFFTTKGVKGTGLGLSVSYGIVERHAGSIEVFSELGSGTTFWVRLPSRGADHDTPPKPVPGGPRILVVEDDDDVLDLISEILQSHNYQVTPARNGRDAVALIEQQRFDALFTDMRMPGVDGWDVIRAAHSRNPGIVVALVTGWANQVRKEDLAENRVHALIGKPFSESEILGVLESLHAES